MHDEDIRRRDLTTAQEDEIMQRSVLTQVLVLHPAQLTILELALRVESDLRDCEQETVERAVRELSRDGLVLCDCQPYLPQQGGGALRRAAWRRDLGGRASAVARGSRRRPQGGGGAVFSHG
ncbi:MAG TPA: hypothetical protein VIY71_05555, partial [Solirubrobacterales bacterium]